jgi:hypothetical protein
VKYFMIGGGGGGMGGDSNSELTQWITEHGTLVPSADWQSTPTSSGNGNAGSASGNNGSMTLYEVKL